MVLRDETRADHDGIGAVHRAAFRDLAVSDQTEHLIVQELRRAGALTVSLVAECDGVVLGHIAFSPVRVGDAEPGWYILGPVGVLPSGQHQGIGSALVEAGLQELRERGAAGCVLVGEPRFYGRFGFAASPELTMEGVPGRYVLGLAFGDVAPAGELVAHEAFGAGRPATP